MQRYEFTIYTAYFQVDLTDLDGVPEESWETICHITDEDCQRRIKLVPGFIKLFTERDGQTPLAVELHQAEPPVDFSAWDHVAEASLNMLSENLTVGGIYDTTGLIPMPPGCYRARFHGANFGSIRDPVLDGGEDHYLVQVWPDSYKPLVVLKQYTRPQPSAA